jgi:hypothetical protein
METPYWKMLCLAGLLLAAAAGGCQKGQRAKADSAGLMPPAELGITIGALAEVIKPEPVAVEGFGLVGGLPAGDSRVPAAVYCDPTAR